MSDAFTTYKLSELTTILVGGDLPDSYSTEKTNLLKIPVYANGEKENGLYGYTDIPEVTEPAVTISARGSKVGFAALRKEPFLPIVRLISLIPYKERLDVNFLFYNLKLNRQTGIGSGQPQITIPDISNRTISVPPLYTQQKIASVLSALDDKIELNNRINTELEAMAKTIYDYWFVQFDFPDVNGKPYKSSGGKIVYNDVLKRDVPEGWEVKRLADVLHTSLGGTPSTKVEEYWNGNINWLNSGEIANFPIVDSELKITKAAIKNSATQLLPKGSVLLSITRHLRPTILAIDACANQSVVGIKEKDDIKHCFIYPYLKNEIPRLMSLRTGAQQPHINKEIVDDSLIIIPDFNSKLLKQYNSIVEPNYRAIFNNSFQNQQLSQLRDWLLPMLMNGQVSVADAYQQAAQALSMAAEDAAGYGKKK
jgi:type I restriction enzyme S subunit